VLPQAPALEVLDSGCGTGYYLERILAALPHTRALELDVSVDAVAAAVRATGQPGLVADVWRPLPVRDDRADVVLCVFAPRNSPEFARVLRDGGSLVVVTPAAEHLHQLRDEGRVIGMQDDKLGHLDAALAAEFALQRRERLAYDLELSEAEIGALSGMGPSGHHATSGTPHSPAGQPTTRTVNVAVDVSVYGLQRA
jgi:23S rRNA (guanine745-N1)-methyltransferase